MPRINVQEYPEANDFNPKNVINSADVGDGKNVCKISIYRVKHAVDPKRVMHVTEIKFNGKRSLNDAIGHIFANQHNSNRPILRDNRMIGYTAFEPSMSGLIDLCHDAGFAWSDDGEDEKYLSGAYGSLCADNLEIRTAPDNWHEDISALLDWIDQNINDPSDRIILPASRDMNIDGDDLVLNEDIVISATPNGEFAVGFGDGVTGDGGFHWLCESIGADIGQELDNLIETGLNY